MNPFDWINSINRHDYIMTPECENKYNPFMVNRGFSLFLDTIMQANRCNQMSHLPLRMQYDYMFHSIPKNKRFSKWFKPDRTEKHKTIKEYYDWSDEKVDAVIDLFDDEVIDKMKNELRKGGQQ